MSPTKTETRDSFLASLSANGFLPWLIERLPSLRIRFHILPSRYVPGGLQTNCKGIESALKHYIWVNDWPTTRAYLDNLSDDLRSAIMSGDDTGTYKAAVAILSWGNVKASAERLSNLRDKGRLAEYLYSWQGRLRLESATIPFPGPSPEWMNSGMTKVVALASNDGLPIYDGRIGGALASLEALYSLEKNDYEPRYPVIRGGASRAKGAIRTPRKVREFEGFSPPEGANDPERWLGAQVRFGWLASELVRATMLFESLGSAVRRMHALESALFMVGYDVRAILTKDY